MMQFKLIIFTFGPKLAHMKNEYAQLLIDVQKKSNISIRTIKDLKLLRIELDNNLEKTIGFNTLRRLFGFLPTTNPSISTLNALSKYLGFSSFPNYKNHQSNYSEWYFQQNLLRLQSQNNISVEAIQEINIGLRDENNLVYLAYFIAYQIEKNNILNLQTLFKFIHVSNISHTQLHKLSTIVITSLNNLPDDKALLIYTLLISNEIFRNNITLPYIDYIHLNSRYSKVLALIENHAANSSDLLFVTLMKYYKHFYCEESTDFSYKIEKPKGFSNFYSVLKGRFYGYCIMQTDQISKKLKKEIFAECTETKISFFFEEIIPSLVIKSEYDFLMEIFDRYYEELLESDIWSTTTSNALYLIGLANLNWNNNQISSAKTNLELINLELVEIGYYEYISLFFYLTKLKISYSESDYKENKIIYKKLCSLVESTYFTKFLTISKAYRLFE
jgi:hypothetical protein